jgi:anti-anti-sigma factor
MRISASRAWPEAAAGTPADLPPHPIVQRRERRGSHRPALVVGDNRDSGRSALWPRDRCGTVREATLMGVAAIDRLSGGTHDTLTIAVWETGTTTELIVSGEWDLAARPTARKAVQAALACAPECVVLNLSQCSFIDSSGLHTVLELHNRCVQQNIHLVIIPGPRAVQRPFEICGLTERLPFLGTPA